MELFDICGFTVTLSQPEKHDIYCETKAAIEKAVSNIQKDIIAHNFYNDSIISQGVRVKNKIFTFAVKNGELYLGLFDKETKQISCNCDYSLIEDMRTDENSDLSVRSSEFIESAEQGLIHNPNMDEAWDKMLEEKIEEEEDGPELSIEMDFD